MAARLIRFILKCACCTCRHFSVPFFLFLYNFLFHRINSRVNSSVIFHLFIHLFKLSIAFWLTVSCGHFSYSHEKHMRFGYNNNENDWEIGEWMFVSVMWIMIYNNSSFGRVSNAKKQCRVIYNMNNNNNCFVPRKQRKTKHSWWDLWGYGVCAAAQFARTLHLLWIRKIHQQKIVLDVECWRFSRYTNSILDFSWS